jgi:hypothetical protein
MLIVERGTRSDNERKEGDEEAGDENGRTRRYRQKGDERNELLLQPNPTSTTCSCEITTKCHGNPTTRLLLTSASMLCFFFTSHSLTPSLAHTLSQRVVIALVDVYITAMSTRAIVLCGVLGGIVAATEAAINSKPELRVVQALGVQEPASSLFCFANAAIAAYVPPTC